MPFVITGRNPPTGNTATPIKFTTTANGITSCVVTRTDVIPNVAVPTVRVTPALPTAEKNVIIDNWPAAGTYRITLSSGAYAGAESESVTITDPPVGNGEMQTRLEALEAQVAALTAAKGAPA